MHDIEITIAPEVGASRRMRTCMVCGVVFKRKSGANAGKCCTRACGFVLRARIAHERASRKLCNYPPEPKQCAVCASRFISDQPGAILCSARCRVVHQEHADHPERYTARACVVCSAQFTRTYGREGARQFCSPHCSDARLKQWKRTNLKARKAKLRGVTVERFDEISVFTRDKWRCQLCLVKTPRRLRGSYEPNAPELDHIKPLALGGAHASWNTQCLCRSCNGIKGATTAGQLRLAV